MSDIVDRLARAIAKYSSMRGDQLIGTNEALLREAHDEIARLRSATRAEVGDKESVSDCPICGGDGKLTTTPGQYGPCGICAGTGKIMPYTAEPMLLDCLYGKLTTFDAICGYVSKLELALVEIAKGEGAFSRDPLKHAENTIESMKRLASEAISPLGDTKP